MLVLFSESILGGTSLFILLTFSHTSKTRWFSGRIAACHAVEPGSIITRISRPSQSLLFYDYFFDSIVVVYAKGPLDSFSAVFVFCFLD